MLIPMPYVAYHGSALALTFGPMGRILHDFVVARWVVMAPWTSVHFARSHLRPHSDDTPMGDSRGRSRRSRQVV